MKNIIESLSEEVWDYLIEETYNIKLTLHENQLLVSKLSLVKPYEFIEYNILNYPSYHLTDLFICIPFVWEKITFSEAKSLFQIVCEKEKFEGLNAMVSFFSKYLRIDSINFLQNISLENDSLRNRFLEHTEDMSGILCMTSIDVKVVNISGIDLEQFKKIGLNLISLSMGELKEIQKKETHKVEKHKSLLNRFITVFLKLILRS